MWVPLRGRTAVLMPWGGSARANMDWLRDLGLQISDRRLQVAKGPNGSWLVPRARTDFVRLCLLERWPAITVVHDVSNVQVCAQACQTANPETALICECSCGGINHGGVVGWQPVGDVAIDFEHDRRIFHLGRGST